MYTMVYKNTSIKLCRQLLSRSKIEHIKFTENGVKVTPYFNRVTLYEKP